MNKRRGYIKWFDPNKGIGFIKDDFGEVFFHQTQASFEPRQYDQVEFEIFEEPWNGRNKQPAATNVELVPADRFRGVVMRVMPDRGFAFVRAEGRDFFVHNSCFPVRELIVGDELEFSIGDSPKGPVAWGIEWAPVEVPVEEPQV